MNQYQDQVRGAHRPVITVGTENSGPVELYYEDYGSGAPVILIHGYPLSHRAWDKQAPASAIAGPPPWPRPVQPVLRSR